MASDDVNNGRRRFLTGTVAVVGGAGLAVTAVPFIKMWQPSARAKAAGAPVEADISKLLPGQKIQVEWRGKPVFIARRTQQMLDGLTVVENKLKDPKSENADQQPEYAANQHRSINPEILVLVGICTHLGCVPQFVPEIEAQPFDDNWQGGFYCPCHKSTFDLAGRVYDGVPAPVNLIVPPYSFLSKERMLIGVGPEGGVA